MKTEREKLVRLQASLETERGRILAGHSARATERLPAHVIRELADIDLAARAVAAELTRHAPRLGYGSET
ncbi:MAG TPA: hypothetical protein VNV18_02230 [Stellaceae bacterium]|jgi:hypothetical protein|nr:hypothetical protein [Stellaceae bacterium]